MNILFIILEVICAGSVYAAIDRIIKKNRAKNSGGELNSPIRENRLRNRRR